jgi:hypothetical protein
MPPPRPNPSGSPAVGGSGGGVDTEGVTETTDFELSQIYALIDSILPFEACLYYQVLPLTIEGTRLVIGMVDPRDYGAESYVRRQLAFINYSITTPTDCLRMASESTLSIPQPHGPEPARDPLILECSYPDQDRSHVWATPARGGCG